MWICYWSFWQHENFVNKNKMSGHYVTKYYNFLALGSEKSTRGFIPWSNEIAQNSSTFPVWSTKNTTLRCPMKMFDRSKDRYLFIWTFLLIANNWCLQLALYQTPGSTVSSLKFNSLAPQEKSIDTWAVLSVSMVETISWVTVFLCRHD